MPSKEIEVDLIQLPVPVIKADKTKYCAGDKAILTVNTPVDPSYMINWYQDGNIITADQDKTSISTSINGNYTITIKSNIAPCTQTSVVQPIAFTPVPVFTFNYPDELRYCDGTPVILKAEGSGNYQYRWYKNEVLTGDMGASLSITLPGKYKVEVSACEGSWVPSKEVQVDFIKLPTPIIQTDKAAYCIGDNAMLSTSVSPDAGYTINWYRDNVLLTANINQTTLNTNVSGGYSISIISNQTNNDGTTCTQTSAVQAILFNPLPTISIQKIVKTSLCDGQTVDLKVSYDNGNVKWSTGESSDQIAVGTSGTYDVTVTSVAGCQSTASINLQFFPNPVLSIANEGICVPSHKTVTLTAPSGLASYNWNGQDGTATFIVDNAETITLTVTDAHGCQAVQEIQVIDECPDIKIPNTFTPNGDGINDTWDIIGLEYDPTTIVKVFSRYGNKVYESKGYGKPWNGEYVGRKLTTGTYYYIITAKSGKQTYSGYLTIIY